MLNLSIQIQGSLDMDINFGISIVIKMKPIDII